MVLLKEVIFRSEIDGFSNVEYLTVLYAIVYGFIISMYFSGWGDMIRSRAHLKFDGEHLAWTIFTFTIFVFNWYGTWHRIEFINVGIGYFFFSLVPPLLFYLMCVILFPRIDRNEFIDFGTYLDKNKMLIFGAMLLYFLVSIISGMVYLENNLLFDEHGKLEVQNIFRGGAVLLSLAAMLIKNRIFHITFLGIGFGMLIMFFATVPTVKKENLMIEKPTQQPASVTE